MSFHGQWRAVSLLPNQQTRKAADMAAADMSIELSGGELTDAEMAKLMETGIECEKYDGNEDECPECGGTGTVMVDSGAPDPSGKFIEVPAPCPDCQLHEPSEIINPVTGAIVSLDDIDSLILGCDECKKQIDELNTFYRTLREAAWAKTTGTTKTRRLRGKKYQAKVVQGDRYPVSAILKEAWNSYPQFRDKYLRISSISLQMREAAKLDSMTSDDKAFVQFKGMIKDSIEKGSEGLPTVSLEEGEPEK